jgi:hypothetical protein
MKSPALTAIPFRQVARALVNLSRWVSDRALGNLLEHRVQFGVLSRAHTTRSMPQFGSHATGHAPAAQQRLSLNRDLVREVKPIAGKYQESNASHLRQNELLDSSHDFAPLFPHPVAKISREIVDISPRSAQRAADVGAPWFRPDLSDPRSMSGVMDAVALQLTSRQHLSLTPYRSDSNQEALDFSKRIVARTVRTERTVETAFVNDSVAAGWKQDVPQAAATNASNIGVTDPNHPAQHSLASAEVSAPSINHRPPAAGPVGAVRPTFDVRSLADEVMRLFDERIVAQRERLSPW